MAWIIYKLYQFITITFSRRHPIYYLLRNRRLRLGGIYFFNTCTQTVQLCNRLDDLTVTSLINQVI